MLALDIHELMHLPGSTLNYKMINTGGSQVCIYVYISASKIP